jgi:methionine synthase II (cobalamin-independent)
MPKRQFPYRADVVGSMLRPPQLVDARRAYRGGRLSAEDYRSLEDAAVDDAVRIQEDAGVDVVTDGEMRRDIFFDFFVSGMDGMSALPSYTVRFRDDERRAEAFTVVIPFSVTDKIVARECPALQEFRYVRQVTDRAVKITLPSPMLSLALWSAEHSSDAYPDPFDLAADAAQAIRGWIGELEREGCEYVQIDAPEMAEVFADAAIRQEYADRGIDPDRMMQVGTELLGSVADQRRRGLKLGIHLCKGNGTQSWIAEGGYDALAEVMLPRISGFDVFHFEFDDERSGGFEPLRHVPDEKVVVLGMVSTKWTALEDRDFLYARIHQAARCHPLDRMALATQCGFASAAETADERKITTDTQSAKLKLVADVSSSVWG